MIAHVQWMLVAILLLLCAVIVQVSCPGKCSECSLTAAQHALNLEEQQLRALTEPDGPK
jgi:hypothetical protein